MLDVEMTIVIRWLVGDGCAAAGARPKDPGYLAVLHFGVFCVAS